MACSPDKGTVSALQTLTDIAHWCRRSGALTAPKEKDEFDVWTDRTNGGRMSELDAFRELFATYEYTLKRLGFRQKGLTYAQADWNVFSSELGQSFFDEVQEAGIAKTLIGEAPGKLLNDPLEWERPDRPLRTTQELLVMGVGRVRNSVVHGEKHRGDEAQQRRDSVLVSEALAVLRFAQGRLEVAEPPRE